MWHAVAHLSFTDAGTLEEIESGFIIFIYLFNLMG